MPLQLWRVLWKAFMISIDTKSYNIHTTMIWSLPLFKNCCFCIKDTTYHGYCVSLNHSHQLTGHGLNLAPRIYNKLRKNAHKKNSPESKETQEKIQLELEPESSFNRYYYSFKIFPWFWLAESTCIIHHNQFLMTKFGRILCLTSKWCQKCKDRAG